MGRRIVGLGAGGHARVLLELLAADGQNEVVGLLDANLEAHGSRVLDVPVLGGDELLPDLVGQGVRHFFMGLGGARDMAPRRRLYERARMLGLTPVEVVHPRAVIATSASLGAGLTALAGAIINTRATVGANVLVNSGAIIEHDCVVGDHVHIATGALLASGVNVGDGCLVGLGACVKQQIRLGENVVVGAGAVVVRDVPPGATVVGVPARPLEGHGA